SPPRFTATEATVRRPSPFSFLNDSGRRARSAAEFMEMFYDAPHYCSGPLPHRMDDDCSRAGSPAADSREPADGGAEASDRGIHRGAKNRHLRSVRAAAAQSRGDESRTRDG